MSTVDADLLIETEGALRVARLNRPAKHNALSAGLRRRIAEFLESAADDDAVGAVLLTGNGATFCAGFDLTELAAADPAAVFSAAGDYHRCLHTFPKPLVAAINGPALAGGFDLALLCDLRVASPQASFGQPQVSRGLPASYELMAALLGVSRARELCLTGRIMNADEARDIGLVSLVPAGNLLDSAIEIAAALAANPGSRAAKERFVAHQPPLFAPERRAARGDPPVPSGITPAG